MPEDQDEEEEGIDSQRVPVPKPPGLKDSVLERLQVMSGLKASPGPSTSGAGNQQLSQALQLLLTAGQLDPHVGLRMKSAITDIIDILTTTPVRQGMDAPAPPPSQIGPPVSIPQMGGLQGMMAAKNAAQKMGMVKQ